VEAAKDQGVDKESVAPPLRHTIQVKKSNTRKFLANDGDIIFGYGDMESMRILHPTQSNLRATKTLASWVCFLLCLLSLPLKPRSLHTYFIPSPVRRDGFIFSVVFSASTYIEVSLLPRDVSSS
jgi:hypothetical protein